jgi:hypothetical protein
MVCPRKGKGAARAPKRAKSPSICPYLPKLGRKIKKKPKKNEKICKSLDK